MSKNEDLKKKLGKSFPKKKPSGDKAKTEGKETTAADDPKYTTKGDRRIDEHKKISVSLYASDFDKIKAIQGFMYEQTGEMLNRSEALKIALRAAPIDSGLIDAQQAVRQEDGRTKSK